MYVPSSELQQYRGQWTCPNCLLNAKEEYEKPPPPAQKHQKYGQQEISVKEKCSYCSRETSVVYYYKGAVFCETCSELQKDSKGNKLPMAVFRLKPSKGKSLLARIAEFIINKILNRPKKKEDLIVEVKNYQDETIIEYEAPKDEEVNKDDSTLGSFKPLTDMQPTRTKVFADFKSNKEVYPIKKKSKKKRSKKD